MSLSERRSPSVPDIDLYRAFELGAARKQAGIAIVDGAGARDYRSFREMLDEASEKAAALAAGGFGPGDRFALFARTTFDFLVGAMACWRLGGVVVPLAFPPRFLSQDAWLGETVGRVTKANVAAVLIGEDENDLPIDGLAHIRLEELKSSTAFDHGFPSPASPALVQFTSGSTSRPRGVVVTHSTLAAQFDGLLEAMDGGRPEGHLVIWLPLYHDLGLVATLMTTLASGDPITLIPPEVFVFDPGLWVLEISRNRADFSAAPAFAYGMAARAIAKGLSETVDLSCWQCAASGGEAVNPKPVNRFFEAAGPLGFDAGGFCAGYGLAEASCVTTVVRPGEGLRIDTIDRSALLEGSARPATERSSGASQFVSCGRPIPGVDVAIALEEEIQNDERVLGEIWVRGKTLMQGYLEDPEATGEAIKGGWLRTGDLGYLWEGELYVTGRAKDVVIVRGQNYSPEDLERVAEEVPGTHWGSSVAIGVRTTESESVLLAAETKLRDPEDLRRLRTDLQKRLLTEAGIAAAEVVLLPPHTLPRTSSGKLQRGDLRRMHENGELRGIDLLGRAESLDA